MPPASELSALKDDEQRPHQHVRPTCQAYCLNQHGTESLEAWRSMTRISRTQKRCLLGLGYSLTVQYQRTGQLLHACRCANASLQVPDACGRERTAAVCLRMSACARSCCIWAMSARMAAASSSPCLCCCTVCMHQAKPQPAMSSAA